MSYPRYLKNQNYFKIKLNCASNLFLLFLLGLCPQFISMFTLFLGYDYSWRNLLYGRTLVEFTQVMMVNPFGSEIECKIMSLLDGIPLPERIANTSGSLIIQNICAIDISSGVNFIKAKSWVQSHFTLCPELLRSFLGIKVGRKA